MAVETLILRPTVSKTLGVSVYPDELDVSGKYHLAVNEEIADGDATYHEYSVSASGCSFYFSVPVEYSSKTPSAIRCVFCARKSNTNPLNISVAFGGADSTLESVVINITEESYKIFTASLSTDFLSAMWEHMVNFQNTGDERAHLSLAASVIGNQKQTVGTRITQVYLEVDFEDTSIHIKKNGSWVETTQMYHKINGTWTEITVEECQQLLLGSDIVNVVG